MNKISVKSLDNDDESASGEFPDDILSRLFSGGEVREELKRAVAQCLAELILPNFALNSNGEVCNEEDSKCSSSCRPATNSCRGPDSASTMRKPSNGHRASSAPHSRRSGPRPPSAGIYKRQNKDGAKSRRKSNRPSTSSSIPLESINNPNSPSGDSCLINRSSSNLLEKSAAIVTEATGRAPPKFDDAFKNEQHHITKAANEMEGSADLCEDEVDGLQRVESWPQHAFLQPEPTLPRTLIRPTTTSRILHSSHSVLRPKPSRPHTTTALDRRKPPPSTAASERAKAEQISSRLLGPITLESRRANYHFVLPHSLQENEWETELARNIINVFSNKVRAEMKGESSGDPRLAGIRNNGHLNKVLCGGKTSLIEAMQQYQTSAPMHSDEQKSPSKLQGMRKGKKGSQQGGPLRLKMIWFTGTGTVQANWDVVNEVDTEIGLDCEELASLEENGRYIRYVGLVETSITRWNNKTKDIEEHAETKQRIWKQLITTCNIFATRLIEKRRCADAMELVEKTFSLINNDLGFLPHDACDDLTGMAKDTYAYYYMRRSKPSASYQYIISAINIYKRRNDALNVAKCRLHQSYIQCAQHKYSDSMESLRKILAMVERGSLDLESENNHQVLLLISVCYHNIAVQQLMLGHVSDACVSSQNARRLARLCLSVSSHYLPILESTHKQSLNELSNVLKHNQNETQAMLFQNLIKELFE